MCGIAGIYNREGIKEEDGHLIRRMNVIQAHRGPDDEGAYADERCALGHRRLAVIDLTRDGHQPFASEDGRFQLVFNGEIFNYIEIRNDLQAAGWQFRTQTDTEVLLKAYLHYGEDCLSRFNGMFAFCIYDSREKSLFLARDRFGIKPLYYYQHHAKFYFASEIKTLLAIPHLTPSVNELALLDYFVFNRTDVFDETFLNEIKRLPKGHKARLTGDGLMVTPWWDPQDYLNTNSAATFEEATRRIEELLVSSVELRLRSDVPLGGCLSGGLDSSILTGVVHHQRPKERYKTFTASFPAFPFDETRYIDNLRQKFDFDNLQTFPDGQKALVDLQRFVAINDEPTTNATFYSLYEVMKLAKMNGVTVLLNGQGGDEIFAGYYYFYGFHLYSLWKQGKRGGFLSDLLKMVFGKSDAATYQTLVYLFLSDKQRKGLLSRGKAPILNAEFVKAHLDQSRIYNEFFDADTINKSLMRHFQYKLEHLLRMEDRISMAFSLEVRLPYLDHRLVEYLLSVPSEFKIKNGELKHLQRKALGHFTTPQILARKDKLGFATPTDEWMKSPAWEQLTRENFSSLKNLFPHVFHKKSSLPGDGISRWKINQLMLWHDQLKSYRRNADQHDKTRRHDTPAKHVAGA